MGLSVQPVFELICKTLGSAWGTIGFSDPGSLWGDELTIVRPTVDRLLLYHT